MGTGAESSGNLYSSMAYFANIESAENKAFVSSYKLSSARKHRFSILWLRVIMLGLFLVLH